MLRGPLLLLALAIGVIPAYGGPGAPPRSPPPALAIVLAENDTHFLELTEWADRNAVTEPAPPRKKIEVIIVGCAGTPECYFFHQKNGRLYAYDPRLKRDWARSLRQEGASLERLRTMRCYSTGARTGLCHVWNTERTRSEFIAASPKLARSLGMFERSPASVNIQRNRRLRR